VAEEGTRPAQVIELGMAVGSRDGTAAPRNELWQHPARTDKLVIVLFIIWTCAVRTLLIVLGIWLLLNVFFVVVMAPPRKPRRTEPARQSGSDFAPAPIDESAYPFENEEKISLRHIIVSVGMGAFFVLSPILLEAIEATKRFFRRGRE
jgi:hypothetical protein